MTHNEAKSYVHSIRNAHKRRYADLYLEYKLGRRPEPQPIGLSLMGAQAVRLALRDLEGAIR
jgi:hypothetical protein